MSKLSQMASVCIFDHMMTGHTTVGEIVNCVFDKYPQEMSDPKLLRQLARAAVTKEVKRQLRNAVKDNEHVQGELQLPGDEPPRALAIKMPSGHYEYVAFELATWPQLMAAVDEREKNLLQANSKYLDFKRKIAVLRPHLEHDHEVTVFAAATKLDKMPAPSAAVLEPA